MTSISVLRANKDFSAALPMTRDKCLTEGYSPSCGILMVCSRHIPISLVVHEAHCDTLNVHRSEHSHMLLAHHFSAGRNYGMPPKKEKKNSNQFCCVCKQLLYNALISRQLRLRNTDRSLGPRTV